MEEKKTTVKKRFTVAKVEEVIAKITQTTDDVTDPDETDDVKPEVVTFRIGEDEGAEKTSLPVESKEKKEVEMAKDDEKIKKEPKLREKIMYFVLVFVFLVIALLQLGVSAYIVSYSGSINIGGR